MPNCKKEHRALMRDEVAEIPQVWMTKRLAVIALQAQGKSGSESDGSNGSKGGRRDRPKGGGEDNKGGGKCAKGCKFIRDNKPCPFGEKCYSFWSHGVRKEPGELVWSFRFFRRRDCSSERHQTGDERCVTVSA
jgi:hypothetical protein